MTRAKRAQASSRRPPARLVRFEEKRRRSVRNLGSDEVRIGRDPTCDWIVDYANVSRHHAVVRTLGDRNVVQDLGSTNGVRVNGASLGGKPHVLEPGDVIELTESVVLLYEEGPFSSSTPWIVTAIAMILLLIASIGLYLSTRDGSLGAAAGDAARPDSRQPEDARTTGPDPAVRGTHPSMHPPGELHSSAWRRAGDARALPGPDAGPWPVLRAARGARNREPGARDWTVASRVQSSGGPISEVGPAETGRVAL